MKEETINLSACNKGHVETVKKTGLIFEKGRVYDIEEHYTERGSYSTKKDVTAELALALKETLM